MLRFSCFLLPTNGFYIMSRVSFFVKVEGHAYSRHRSPTGVYKVDVREEKTVKHSACAAMEVARQRVPFLNENPHGFTFRTFLDNGEEVVVPKVLATQYGDHGSYDGRQLVYPTAIADR